MKVRNLEIYLLNNVLEEHEQVKLNYFQLLAQIVFQLQNPQD